MKKDNCNPTPSSSPATQQAKTETCKTKHAGLLNIKAANEWIKESLTAPDPKMYFYDLIVEYENTVIFAASNVGKSILATQIAEEISKTEKVLYVDLELSSKQFQMRYSDTASGKTHVFPDNFQRAEIDPELMLGADLEQEKDRNELAEQLMKLNEQLAIRNRRARRIWKTVGITLAVLAGTILLLIVLGVGVFSFDRSEGGMKRVEETGTIEEAQFPAEGERGPGEIVWNW